MRWEPLATLEMLRNSRICGRIKHQLEGGVVEHFGEKLRRLRGERTQKSVAEDLNIPQTTLSSLEKQKSIPRGDVLKNLADYFNIPIEYFYDAPELRSSEDAKAWLNGLRKDFEGRDTVATHSSVQYDSKTLEQIAAKLREKRDETSEK
jgi:transcriptional regulator with XRE-family HTH domain